MRLNLDCLLLARPTSITWAAAMSASEMPSGSTGWRQWAQSGPNHSLDPTSVRGAKLPLDRVGEMAANPWLAVEVVGAGLTLGLADQGVGRGPTGPRP
jgi:hypothetical protein